MASGARVVAKACLASTPRWIRILGRDLLVEVQNLEASKSAGHLKNIGDPPELARLVVGTRIVHAASGGASSSGSVVSSTPVTCSPLSK